MTPETLHSATPLSHLALFLSSSARLSKRQRAALTELAAGRPILAAAAAAGVHRSTLHGWLSHSQDFQAAHQWGQPSSLALCVLSASDDCGRKVALPDTWQVVQTALSNRSRTPLIN